MKPTNPIRITHPSAELVAFIVKTKRRKNERLEEMRQEFLQTQGK